MFKNKSIVITGSEGLVGRSLIKHFNKLNANVSRLDLKSNVSGKDYFKCDITKEPQVKRCISKIYTQKGLDVLINNASSNPQFKNNKRFKFSNYNLSTWKRNLDVDLTGSFLMSKYACKYFELKNEGTIINISSIYGLVGPDQEIYGGKKKEFFGYKPLEYSVAKSGIIGFTKALASYYKKTNIRVLCLILGGIETNDMKKGFTKKYSSKTIINRMANLSEYNEFVSFFASEKAKYATGSCVVIDGGATSIL